jgi:hypothetical protein
MLFDLQGRRRRVVQVTYIGLALLMGGGLVLSGIGSDASGGLLDAFVGGGDGGVDKEDQQKPFNDRINAAQAQLRTNPRDQAALAALVRAHFQLAALELKETNDGGIEIEDKAKHDRELAASAAAWKRYIGTNPERIDSSLTLTALQVYQRIGLPQEQKDKNDLVVKPMQALAEQQNTADAYVKLVEVATLAGDTRIAGLAERKALSFAQSKDEKTTIQTQIDEAKATASQAASGAGGNGAAPPAGGP